MKPRKFILSGILGLLAIALISGISLMAFSPAQAAPADQTTTTAAATTTPGSTKTGKNADKGQYRDLFKQNFATALGVDSTKLNSAYTTAVDQTVDQAVKDGKLTQAQADKIKNAAKNGFKGGIGPGKTDKGDLRGQFKTASVDAVAKALGISTDELKKDLKGGQTIADVAKAKNIDLATVKTTLLNDLKTRLDTAVKDGKLTQAQADKINQAASSRIDTFLNRSFKGKSGKANQ